MLLLATDTSGKHGSVALARAQEGMREVELIDEVPLAGGTFSAQLVPQIAALLAKHGSAKTDIDAFIVVSGPGSFTGLRVGLAAIKALAEILHRPIVPISLLEVIAIECGHAGKILPVLDAGRDEVYAGQYDVAEGGAQLVQEQLLSRDEFVRSAGNQSAVTPDAALAAALRSAGVSTALVKAPNAEMIARLGWQKLQKGEIATPLELDANYIRRSDAEIFAKLR